MSCIGGGLSQLRSCGALGDIQAGLTVLSMPVNAGVLNLANTRPATVQPCGGEPRTWWWLAVNVTLVSMQQVSSDIEEANAIDKTCSILQLLRKRRGSTPFPYSTCVMRSSTVAKSKASGYGLVVVPKRQSLRAGCHSWPVRCYRPAFAPKNGNASVVFGVCEHVEQGTTPKVQETRLRFLPPCALTTDRPRVTSAITQPSRPPHAQTMAKIICQSFMACAHGQPVERSSNKYLTPTVV